MTDEPVNGTSACKQGLTETCVRPGQANNLVLFQTYVLQKSVQHLFTGGGEKLIFY
jgi:hypothetical protein